ncbi:helix-turn-helix transcriptional regulator [Salinibacterium sp. dk2585]|uniref:winged helix-turn-helix transcriptional regulator n=1 Tax=unclassified Salinibacterium TaxID=2632331 RepID=UPI0011C24F45|nr:MULTISPECIES: helix-turn-helix domain-containing protein [unclassified Salinibacterium]QEE61996.1 helix-turn-helix transcriptional regulator [Salinibacterium sp. dk2585]TXK54449.1 helix-turn-helix transcriptional regulator [Salinibacterium sp. dk5596]
MASRNYGQYCGVTTALELVGERWALLIVRDLLVGPRRYTDLKAGLPRIPTNILSARLKELQEAGVVHRVPLAHCGLVYELTPYGRELEDVVLALGRWGFKAMGEPGTDDVITSDSMTTAFRAAYDADAAAAHPPTTYHAHIGEVALALRTGPEGLRIAPRPGSTSTPVPTAHRFDEHADLVFAAGPGIRSLISGELKPADAIEGGTVHVIDGDPTLLGRFAATFHLEPAAGEHAA